MRRRHPRATGGSGGRKAGVNFVDGSFMWHPPASRYRYIYQPYCRGGAVLRWQGGAPPGRPRSMESLRRWERDNGRRCEDFNIRGVFEVCSQQRDAAPDWFWV